MGRATLTLGLKRQFFILLIALYLKNAEDVVS
jgi:hypothetical protein